MVEIQWVDHMTVSDKVSEVPGAKIFMPGYWFWGAKKEMYEDWTLAFFDAHLKGDRAKLEKQLILDHCLINMEYQEN